MNYNDDKVKDLLKNVEVPEEVYPENMKKMLDEKAPAKKRSSRISIAGRITAAAAACAVIVGATVGTTGLINRDKKGSVNCPEVSTERIEPETQNITIEVPDEEAKGPYMNSAESYEQVYALVEKANEERGKYLYGTKGETKGEIYFEDVINREADNAVSAIPEEVPAVDGSINSEYTQGDFVSGGMGGGTEPEQQYIIQEESEESATEAPAEPITESPTEAASEEVTESPVTEEPTEQATEEPTEAVTEETTETVTEETTEEITEAEDEDDYSDTYNQEENVLEADIVKTDGERIYYLFNDYDYENATKYSGNYAAMRVAAVDDGEISDAYTLNIEYDCGLGDEWEKNISVNDMYIYNDMLAVVGMVDAYHDTYTEFGWDYDGEYCFYGNETTSFVSFYTKENEPQLIGTYTQDGRYNDVRIAPDGYMYLLTNYNTDEFDTIEDSEDIDGYVPKCGVDNSEYIPAGSILLPEDELDNYEYMSYTVIGSINLTVSGEFTACDTKALAGYSGIIYSSADNLYTMTTDYSDTDITRIAIGGGQIVPMASGTVEGTIKDQFSFSEYNGYLRVAATINKWVDNGNFIKDVLDIPYESRRVNHNNVYVLDMDMNIVGSVEGFGVDESIKSVSFSGDMGYVVTYEQTDPLFAIDLSDPANPFITDEFKILGYSTYMQKWDEGLLLGFGADADENGIENGVKLVMFDNSDPYNLKEVGLYPIHHEGDSYIYSGALWERKALLIAPNKNLIGVPVTVETYSPEYHFTGDSKYMFFSYENGEFVFKGELSLGDINGYGGSRALYIGDYVYAVSQNCFISADIETLTEVDRFYF
ncbi:MAG: beta-propeller domain-containing protein [Ruminococcus sp.]|nr:beta-propeller domain-containing protein [Ruminococcus sp.]